MCNRSFDDLTSTVFAGHHQPLSVWMLCLYFMGLNLSHHPIAAELEMNEDSIQEMTTILRNGIVAQSLPIYVGFFQCVHNVRRRGNSLLRTLVETLVATNPERR